MIANTKSDERAYLEYLETVCPQLWATFSPAMKKAFRKLIKTNAIHGLNVSPATLSALRFRGVLRTDYQVYKTRKPRKIYRTNIRGDELVSWLTLTRQKTKDRS